VATTEPLEERGRTRALEEEGRGTAVRMRRRRKVGGSRDHGAPANRNKGDTSAVIRELSKLLVLCLRAVALIRAQSDLDSIHSFSFMAARQRMGKRNGAAGCASYTLKRRRCGPDT
jgi:hypothetical protein